MPEAVEVRPVVVLPLWRRDARQEDAKRPGVLRGHPGPAASDRAGPDRQERQGG
ncbi:hypothetical protein ABT247_11075 [Kitasatospora sp. NPDC001539]|uniref:hypothetical protein n=1 Tax=Kitasatospora sp. NPDC001539 TaxID=3154384 RepID=UPI0033316219